MFDHVLVADDGSEQSRAGFAHAVALAAHVEGRVTVVSAVPWPDDLLASIEEPMPGLDRLLETRERECADRLAALAATAPDGVTVETRVLRGKPAPAVIEAIEELRPDLVVAGTHGVGFTRFVLGSVSQRLLEHSPADLLLVRGPHEPDGPAHVVAAVDGSRASTRGVERAAALATATSARLVLVHVVDDTPLLLDADRTAPERARERGAALLRDARASIPDHAGEVEEDVRTGHPREGLIAACADHAPAIAVVGSRGIGGFHGLLVGSMARDLVNHADCPVLVTRAARTAH